ncbi:MAG: hypothetical protein SFX18_05330 [Pirellulales bacterium]|nr:hypothetical protein [Pirellulales bacterium]
MQMARQYAVILGLLAFTVTMARSLWHYADGLANVWMALGWMAGFACLGAIVGGLADWMLGDALRRELSQALAAQTEAGSTVKPGT